MLKRVILLAALAAIPACHSPPKMDLRFDSAVHHIREREQLRKGDLVVNSPPYVIAAQHPQSVIRGRWGADSPKWERQHYIYVAVQRRDCREIARTIAELKGDNGEYKTFGSLCHISIYGRFTRRRFSWGDAVSFIAQGTQDGPYAPDNGHMTYQIWGCTDDRKHLVHLSVGITHPSWPDWPDVRDYSNQKALNADPDVRRLGRLAPSSFTPPLLDIDALAATLKLGTKD